MASVVQSVDAMRTPLTSAFLLTYANKRAAAGLPSELSADAALCDRLEAALAAALSAARTAWPAIGLDDQVFVQHLAQHTPAESLDVVADLPTQHVSDLYLACGCAQGLQTALSELDRRYVSKTGAYLSRLRPTPQLIDDTQQALRARLLLTEPQADGLHRRCRIAQYSGRGTLESFVCAAAIRLALTLLKRDQRPAERAAQSLNPLSAERLVDPNNQELALLKSRHAADFAACLRIATAALSARDRNLLRMYHVQKLNILQLARAFACHRTTISRWLDEAHYSIFHGTRQALAARLHISEDECESLLGLVRSRLELSLPSLLATPSGPAPRTARPRS